MRAVHPADSDDVVLAALPLHHIFARPDEECGEIPTAIVVLRQPAAAPGRPAAS
jgi:long-subunit acyl-CoA synthetase (AMP-forming)